MADKKPITNLKTVLNDLEYHKLVKGSDMWKSKAYQKSAETMRKRAKIIGDGLNAYYLAFESNKMRRDDKAKRIEEFFPLMDIKERSDFRYYAKWFPQIETWTMANYPKGYNIANIIKGFQVMKNKEYKPLANMFNEAYAEGHDLFGNPSNVAYDKDQETFVSKDTEYLKTKENKPKKKPVVMQDVKRKEGVVVITSKVTVQDFKGITDKYFNNATNLFNNDKFSATDNDMAVLKHIVKRAKEFIELTELTVNMELKKVA